MSLSWGISLLLLVGLATRLGAQPPIEPFTQAALSQYRVEVLSAASQFRRYPPQAVHAEAEGRTVVRVEIDENGRIEQISIRESSGNALLDSAASEMISMATRRTKIPGGLEGRRFSVDLPVVFHLK